MFIYFKTKNYKNFLNKENYTSPKIAKNLNKANIAEKIIYILSGIIILIWLYIFIMDSNITILTPVLALFISFPFIALAAFVKMYKHTKHSHIDKEIFENILTKKMKIFYSKEEARDFSYTEVNHEQERISTSIISGCLNTNQVVILLAYRAYISGLDGIIMINRTNSSQTFGEFRKYSGYIFSLKEEDGEAIFIKDIKQKEQIVSNNNIPSNTKDLNYWFDLKEKGAITQEEFDTKKKELL